MDVSTITQLINGVGFPIFACIALGLFIVWDRKSGREERAKTAESQNKLLQDLAQSVDNNTKVVERLVEKLEGVD